MEVLEKENKIELPSAMLHSSWLYANEKQIGFYRTLYEDEDMRKSLFNNVMQLDSSERMALQNDWFALSYANYMDISKPVLLASQYTEEESYAVWADLAANLGKLLVLWEEEPSSRILADYCKSIFTSVLHHIGWENQNQDTDLRILLRTLMLKYAGALGDEKTVNFAKSQFSEHVQLIAQNKKGIHADIENGLPGQGYSMVENHRVKMSG